MFKVIKMSKIVGFFIRDLTRNSKCPSEFCLISRNWGNVSIQNLARMPLMKFT